MLGTHLISVAGGIAPLINAGYDPAATVDPYYQNVALLMHMNGVEGGTVFTEQKGAVVTAAGSAVTTTANYKFGGSSGKIIGAGNAAYLTSAQSVTFGYAKAFTIEGWVYLTTATKNVMFGAPNGSAYSTQYGFGFFDATYSVSGLCFILSPVNGYSGNLVGGGVYPALNTWTHFAIVRDNSNNWSFFINGVKGTTTNGNASTNVNSAFPANNGPTGAFTIPLYFGDFNGVIGGGNSSGFASNFNGYVNDVRITDGIARYNANFAVPTAAFPNPNDPYFANVSLLAHMEGTNGATTFTEQKGNTFTVAGGTPTISTAVYRFGSSSLSHPTGSYMSTPASTAFDITTGPFTVEAFIYITAYNAAANNGLQILTNWVGSGAGWCFSMSNTGTQVQFISGSSAGYKDQALSTTFTGLSLNAWHHVAVSFDGTTYSFYADGVRYGTALSNGSVPAGGALTIGAYTQNLGFPSSQWAGYLDDVRITKGVGRYTGSSFVVPAVFSNQ